MKMLTVIKPPCQLKPGELRRVPIRPDMPLIGLHLCCPSCGFNSFISGREITQDHEGLVSFSTPHRCIICQILIHLEAGEAQLEEDENV